MFEEKMFSEKDKRQIQNLGITPEQIELQLENFRKGFPYAELAKPSTPESGLKSFTEKYAGNFAAYFSDNMLFNSIVKFVPASGAASRMFSHLFAWLEKNNSTETQSLAESEYSLNSPEYFIKNITKFAFFSDLKDVMAAKGQDVMDCIKNQQYTQIIDFLLNEKGLNYANLPKALIKFHSYNDMNRTALDEHLAESVEYCRNDNCEVHIHFTVSPEHIEKFEAQLKKSLPFFEERLNVKYHISHSVQKTSTDIIAVDENNEPFRNADGSLLFRPGGHGALIHNLNDINADIVFVKNIDNVAPVSMSKDTVFYKKVLAGYLLYLRFHVYEYLRLLETDTITDDSLSKIINFIHAEFSHDFPDGFNELELYKKISYLRTYLHRPLRVCGMVKNQGEPGGGPFFVKDLQGNISQQIVESSQIDMNDEQQKTILSSATHFNPVDLVCSFIDYKGNKFDLLKFVDPSTGFISSKTKDGKPLKAQELPGLWNGAMAKWNTVFVEVPVSTFNPVKTVNDLLRKEHVQ